MKFKLSKHTQDMLKERDISEEWVWRTIDEYYCENMGEDTNIRRCRDGSARHEAHLMK